MSRSLFAAAVLAASLSAGAAMAETVTFHATMNGASEVPANTSKGTGTATATLNTVTHALAYTVTYSGLTG
ncbi:MAG: CHRD domain-containing protein, partial [Rhodospirillales bacterium]|nr:CHRD domain-containing protein [Rhodospirillales bacterium]